MLSRDPGGWPVGPAKYDGTALQAPGHVEGLGRRVDQLVDRLHCEIEGHELDDGTQATKRRADTDARETRFRDRRVDHPLGTKLLEQALADLVGALIFRDLLTHQEDALVAPHLLGHGVAQGLADGHRCHGATSSAPAAA